MSNRNVQAKNRAPASIQITAEQILREAKDRQLDVEVKAPRQQITDEEELRVFRMRKRKEVRPRLLVAVLGISRERTVGVGGGVALGDMLGCHCRVLWAESGTSSCRSPNGLVWLQAPAVGKLRHQRPWVAEQYFLAALAVACDIIVGARCPPHPLICFRPQSYGEVISSVHGCPAAGAARRPRGPHQRGRFRSVRVNPTPRSRRCNCLIAHHSLKFVLLLLRVICK